MASALRECPAYEGTEEEWTGNTVDEDAAAEMRAAVVFKRLQADAVGKSSTEVVTALNVALETLKADAAVDGANGSPSGRGTSAAMTALGIMFDEEAPAVDRTSPGEVRAEARVYGTLALACFRAAVNVQPSSAELHHNVAIGLQSASLDVGGEESKRGQLAAAARRQLAKESLEVQ
jgi:hypothetical protein